MSKQTQSLEELVGGLVEPQWATVDVDVSEHFGQPAGTVLFTLAEPSVAAIFMAQQDAAVIKRSHLEWPELMCQTVALLAVSHRAPAPAHTAVGRLYCDIAERSPALFMRLASAFGQAFPHLGNMDQAADEAKNA